MDKLRTPNKAVALRILELLEEKQTNKYQLEKKSGVTHSAMRYIFNEVNKDVKLSTIIKFCSALGITLEYFFSSSCFDLEKIECE